MGGLGASLAGRTALLDARPPSHRARASASGESRKRRELLDVRDRSAERLTNERVTLRVSTSASTTSGTRSGRGWRPPACRCARSKSGWGTVLDHADLARRFRLARDRTGIRHRDFATTLVYADYQPDAGREAEFVERAFGLDTKFDTNLSETEPI